MLAWWQRALPQVAPYASTAVDVNIPVGSTATTVVDLRMMQFGCATQTARKALQETITRFHVGVDVMPEPWSRAYWK